jgi:excisionase family DNA binding protein
MQAHPIKRLLTLRQASEILSLSVNTLRNLIASGKLGAVRSGPRSKILVDVCEIEAFCERNALPRVADKRRR